MAEKSGSTALALVEPRTVMQQVFVGGAPELLPAQMEMYTNQAAWFFRARQFPQYTSAEAMFVAMMTLRDMGISPTAGLPCGYQTPAGKLDFEVKVKLAAVQGRCPTFEYEVLESDEKRCRIKGRLGPDRQWKEAEFTIERAQRAGLVKEKSSWVTYPQEQLFWKAMIRLLRTIAGPLLFGMALPQLVIDAIREDAEAEVIETRPLTVEAGAGRSQDEPQPRTESGAPAPETPVETESSEKRFFRIIRQHGYVTHPKTLAFINLVMKEDLGLQPVKRKAEISTSEWDKLLAAMEKRGWTDKNVDVSRPESEAVEASSEPDFEPAAPTPPPAESKSVSYIQPSDPVTEQLARWHSGEPKALVEYGQHAKKLYAAKGHQRRFVAETDPPGSGVWWFIDQTILLACGSTRPLEDGRSAPESALLLVGDNEKWKDSVASEGLRVMLARGVQNALADLEGGGR